MRELTNEQIETDVVGAKDRLIAACGALPMSFCYPQAKWSRRVEAIVRRHHTIIVTGGGTPVNAARPWRVRRVSVVRGGLPLELMLQLPFHPREWLADRVRQWR